jgi:Curli production assembly/transport component CsgG
MRARHVAVAVCVLAIVLAATAARGQDDPPQVKVGVLPFVDATGSGGVESGATIGRLVQAEIVHSTELLGRVLKADGTTPEDIDVAAAAEIGRSRSVDLVLIGTVLDASSSSSRKGANTGRIFGQSVGADVQRAKATVELQGDIVKVATGRRIASLRVKGEDSDTRVGATAWTNLGSISSDSSAWMESPLGRALQKAVAELVRRLNVEASRIER